MATELEKTVRKNWAWRKRGKVRWLPLPIDKIGIPEMYLIQGFYFLIICTPSDFADDLEADINDVFLNIEEFATKGYYTDVEDNMYEIPGIYDDPYEESLPETTIGIQSRGPRFKVQESDLITGVRKGDKINICVRGDNKSFEIVEKQPDGVGLVDLILHELLV